MVDPEKKEKPQRLQFEGESGWYRFGRIPYKIFYLFSQLNSKNSLILNEKNPAKSWLTPDLVPRQKAQGYSLSIIVHKSVPKEFRDVVIYHELSEQEAVLADELPLETAHEQADAKTDEYARTHLTEEESKRYFEWKKSIIEEKK